jgi:hypothetical protein
MATSTALLRTAVSKRRIAGGNRSRAQGMSSRKPEVRLP